MIGDKNRLKNNSDFTHFKTNGDTNIKTLFEEYNNCTPAIIQNAPSALELPATIQIDSVELNATTDPIVQKTIEVWPHKGWIPISQKWDVLFPPLKRTMLPILDKPIRLTASCSSMDL